MQLKRVVLPAPLGPMRPTISPGSMASEMSLLASRPPKRVGAASTLSSGAMGAGRRRRRGRPAPAKPAPPPQRERAGRPGGGDEKGDESGDDEVARWGRQRAPVGRVAR